MLNFKKLLALPIYRLQNQDFQCNEDGLAHN